MIKRYLCKGYHNLLHILLACMLTGCIPENIELPTIVEAVDLGLSVKWASCNVGAAFTEDYGDYFAWGEIRTKSNYGKSNSDTYDRSNSVLKSWGVIDSDGNLTARYDAATVHWGSDWRMPTLAEIQELVNDCTWEWTTMNGVNGCKVSGSNGNSIFLPAAGYRRDTSRHGADSCGCYWAARSRDLVVRQTSYCIGFSADSCYYSMSLLRSSGCTVRPVRGAPLSVTTGKVSDITDCGAILSGTVCNSNKSVTCGIIYGTSASLSITSGTMKSTTSSDEFSVSVTGLSASTTYYYRSYVVVGGVYRYGDVLLFTTKGKTSVTSGGAIDLGLSVKWASCNVGADSHEDYGDYFAWGETLPKSDYLMSNSATYDLSHSELKSRGVIGSDGNLTAAYDAAIVNWGSDWRMPTLAEIKELVNDCTWELITINGVSGNKVTGPNGNFIFLPAAGLRNGTEVRNSGSSGYYWSATHYERYPYRPYRFLFYEGDWKWDYFISYDGLSVRPVTEK